MSILFHAGLLSKVEDKLPNSAAFANFEFDGESVYPHGGNSSLDAIPTLSVSNSSSSGNSK